MLNQIGFSNVSGIVSQRFASSNEDKMRKAKERISETEVKLQIASRRGQGFSLEKAEALADKMEKILKDEGINNRDFETARIEIALKRISEYEKVAQRIYMPEQYPAVEQVADAFEKAYNETFPTVGSRSF